MADRPTPTAPASRLDRLRALILAEHELAALIVEDEVNVRYLTGFTGSAGLLVLAADGADRFLTDSRYGTQAASELVAGLRAEVVSRELLDAARERLPRGRVGFDANRMTVARWRRLEQELPDGVELIAVRGLIEGLRIVKDAGEQERIAAAAALVDEIFDWLLERGLEGRSERVLAAELEHQMRLRGASGPSFPSIVAGGAHAALPHAQPRDVALERGMLVTFDIGARLDGYCSDATRTFAVGEPGARAREVHGIVLAAQLEGLGALRAGVSGVSVDAAARSVIEAAGFGEQFGHGLGHGVGLEIHEAPRLSRTVAADPLANGTVVTVEPGIYLPGELGVRIEDLVIVEADGVRNLNRTPKELLVVD
jgi:Xaa-Pro aminopeptidase